MPYVGKLSELLQMRALLSRRNNIEGIPAHGADLDIQVGGVGGSQDIGKGGLRAPSRSHGTHGHASHQPDEEDHGQVAAPATVQCGPEPVPRDRPRDSLFTVLHDLPNGHL